jgi:hypothetical protein
MRCTRKRVCVHSLSELNFEAIFLSDEAKFRSRLCAYQEISTKYGEKIAKIQP